MDEGEIIDLETQFHKRRQLLADGRNNRLRYGNDQ
jgi:hypothetical protein